MRIGLSVAVMLCPSILPADTVIATRTIRANSQIAASDVTLQSRDTLGTLSTISEAVGKEARITLYAGRPIRPEDLGPPALIDRNQLVTIGYSQDGVTITAEGRALSRGGAGDIVRVMNLNSRNTVTGQVLPDGSVNVGSHR